MRCRKVRSFLSTYSRGETTPEQTARIESHLTDCSACRRERDVYMSLNRMFTELPQTKTSDDFTDRLFTRIGQENFAEKRSMAYLPGKIPRFGGRRLATVTASVMVILALGLGIKLGDRINLPSSPQMAVTQQTELADAENLYMTVQPSDNPLLNERKGVSKIVQQYNRFREYSRSLRTNGAVEQLMTNASNATLTSTGTSAMPQPIFRVRPVIKNYLIVPDGNTLNNSGAVY